jgi:hypothetical protein
VALADGGWPSAPVLADDRIVVAVDGSEHRVVAVDVTSGDVEPMAAVPVTDLTVDAGAPQVAGDTTWVPATVVQRGEDRVADRVTIGAVRVDADGGAWVPSEVEGAWSTRALVVLDGGAVVAGTFESGRDERPVVVRMSDRP